MKKLLLILLILLASNAEAANRYVDGTLGANCTSGNYSIASRNCTGSDGNAYQTLNGVAPGTVAGDTIHIRAGTYAAGLNCQSVTCNDGTVGNVITLKNYLTEVVTLNGQINFYDQNVQYWTIIGSSRTAFIIDLNGSNVEGLQFGGSGTNGADNIVVELITIRETGKDGAFVRGTGNTFRNMLFSENGDNTDSPAMHGIYFSESNSNHVVEDSTFEDCGANCIQFYDTTNTSSNNTVRRNIWRNQAASTGFAEGGLSFRGQTNFKVYNNIQYDVINTDGGTYCIDSLSSNVSPSIWNNICVGNGNNKGITITSASNATVQNNIVWNHTSDIVNTGTNTTCTANLSDSAVAGCVTLTTSVSPFTSIAGDDYTHATGGSGLGAGIDLSANFTTDILGATRVTPWDLGAYDKLTGASLTLTTPNGGQSYPKNTAITVTWTSVGTPGNVDIKYGTDGVTFGTVLVNATSDDGTQSATLPNAASATAYIQVCDDATGLVCDASDASFVVTDAAGGTVTKVISNNTTGTKIGDISGTEDAELFSTQPTLNQASASPLYISKVSSSNHSHGLLRFPVTGIPAAATVTSVTFGLWLEDAVTAAAQTLDVRKMLRAWIESQATWNIYSTGNNWNTAGGLGAASDRVDTAVAQLTSVTATTGLYYTVTQSGSGGLYDLAQAMVTAGTPVDLHVSRNGAGEDGAYRGFTSSEGTNGQRPYLEITYTTSTATISVTQPATGAHYFPGMTVPVRWATDGVSGNVQILLSRDGSVFDETVSASTAFNASDVAFEIPVGRSSSNCLIKVVSINDSNVLGISAPFRIGGTKLGVQ